MNDHREDGFYWARLTDEWEVVHVRKYKGLSGVYVSITDVYVCGYDMPYDLKDVKEWGPKLEPPGDGNG